MSKDELYQRLVGVYQKCCQVNSEYSWDDFLTSLEFLKDMTSLTKHTIVDMIESVVDYQLTYKEQHEGKTNAIEPLSEQAGC